MIGQVRRSDGTINLFPFIIQKIKEVLENDDIKDIYIEDILKQSWLCLKE